MVCIEIMQELCKRDYDEMTQILVRGDQLDVRFLSFNGPSTTALLPYGSIHFYLTDDGIIRQIEIHIAGEFAKFSGLS